MKRNPTVSTPHIFTIKSSNRIDSGHPEFPFQRVCHEAFEMESLILKALHSHVCITFLTPVLLLKEQLETSL